MVGAECIYQHNAKSIDHGSNCRGKRNIHGYSNGIGLFGYSHHIGYGKFIINRYIGQQYAGV